jgi:hypothetical protein
MTVTDEIASAMATEDNEAFLAATEKFYRQIRAQGVSADEGRAIMHELVSQAWSQVNAKS